MQNGTLITITRNERGAELTILADGNGSRLLAFCVAETGETQNAFALMFPGDRISWQGAEAFWSPAYGRELSDLSGDVKLSREGAVEVDVSERHLFFAVWFFSFSSPRRYWRDLQTGAHCVELIYGVTSDDGNTTSAKIAAVSEKNPESACALLFYLYTGDTRRMTGVVSQILRMKAPGKSKDNKDNNGDDDGNPAFLKSK